MSGRRADIAAMAAMSATAFWAGGLFVECAQPYGAAFVENAAEIAASMPGYIASGHLIPTGALPLASGLALATLAWLPWIRYNDRRGTYRDGEEHGSSRWATVREMRPYMDERDPYNNIILTERARLRFVDTVHDRLHERNDNVLVIGGSGSGKTRSYVVPNILQMNANYVITDPKGTIVDTIGWPLSRKGYELRVFTTLDPARSRHYNPLAYAYDEQKILSIVNGIIENTTGDEEHANDPFWENAEKLLYTALIAFLIYHCPPEDRNIPGLLTLLSLAEAREDDEDYMSPLDLMFHELETGMRYVRTGNAAKKEFDAEDRSFATSASDYEWVRICDGIERERDFALQSYCEFKVAAGKTMKSILVSCNVRMKPFTIPSIRELLSYDEMRLDELGEEGARVALVASLSDTDSTFDFLFAILMWQAMDVLCDVALDRHGGSLPRPVHFMLDEFANIGKIPDFERKIAVIRSRNISASMVLQSMSQLAASYGENGADVITDCCDTTLFLGGKSEKTKKAISEGAGKQTVTSVTINDSRGNNYSMTHNYARHERDLIQASEVGRLPADEAIVIINGENAFRDKKYRLSDHPRYRESDEKRGRFDYGKDAPTGS